MHPNNGRASWGCLWQPHWWTGSLVKSHPSKVLLAKNERRLREICPTLWAMLEARCCDRFTTHGVSMRGEYTFWALSLWPYARWSTSSSLSSTLLNGLKLSQPVAQIFAHKVQHFVWKNIVCRFGIPRLLVSDNGTQFGSQQLGKMCRKLGIK